MSGSAVDGRPMAGRRIRVAYVTAVADTVRLILMHDLLRLKDRVDATVICADGPGVDVIRGQGITVITIPIRRKLSVFADAKAVYCLWRILRVQRFDLLHSWAPKGGLIGQLAAVLAGVPARLHACRGLVYWPGMPQWRRRLYRFTDRVTNSLAHRTLFNSRADRDYAVAEGLCVSRKACFTGSGIDIGFFNRAEVRADEVERVRGGLGIPPGDPLILTVGRFVADKGYRELLKAAHVVHRTWPGARFVWLAPILQGEDSTMKSDCIAEAGLESVIARIDEVADPRRFYAAAAVLVHPSHREGVPRVLLEAAAMGLPIVASNIAGCREVVSHGRTALLFAPGDADAIVDAIHAVLRDPAAAATRARVARRDVLSRFDQDAHSAKIWLTYVELIRGTRVCSSDLGPA